ncbi:hypothetical protein THRCLA_03505 [Thraustotheca clavata]|uniref:Protein C10 n=1 Tax=Thraustotheca clavata TaxID=74557 RepID=A0A1W0A2I6_9STRA|nr:hypothetical protein THRCLA_03505 [Thraustotheca clavata]
MCRTKTTNVYYEPPPNDKLRELERLLKEDATEMLTSILQAFDFDHNKTRLSEVKAIAQGQLLKVAKLYIPIAVDIVGAVITQYGFNSNLEGVLKSIRALQEHVGDDTYFLEGLERLRILFSPFNAFELEDAKIRQDEVDAQNDLLRQEELRALEAKKLEDIAQERRNAALKRAKKVARGLNPNELYLPVIARQPPSSIVLLPGRRAFISIVADRTEAFQWYFNDVKLSEDTPGLQGTTSSFLKIYYFTKSMCGIYKCECTNDDGLIESSTCTITRAILKPILRRRVLCGGVPHAITLTSFTNVLTIMTPKNLQLYSSLNLHLHSTLNPMMYTEQLLAMASHNDRVIVGLSSGCTIVCRSTIEDTPAIKPPQNGGPSSRRNSIISNLDAKASARRMSTSTATVEYLQKSQSTLRTIRSITFMCNSSWLILSDLEHTIQLYNVANSSELPLLLATFVITIPKKQRILRIAASSSLLYFAMAFENTRRVDLYHVSSILYSKVTIPTTCKVSAMAFPRYGYQLALGEHGVMYGHLHVVNLETKARNVYLKAHFGPILHMEYMSNIVLCSLGMDQIIKIWDTSIKTCLIEFNSFAAMTSSLLVYGCTIVVGYYTKQVELWEIESLDKVLESIEIEHQYAIVLIQKHWRGSLARYRLKKSTEDNQESIY